MFVKISDGEIDISQEVKRSHIQTFSKRGTVISEIGSKNKDKVKVSPHTNGELIIAGLDADSSYIIAEGKESGTMVYTAIRAMYVKVWFMRF